MRQWLSGTIIAGQPMLASNNQQQPVQHPSNNWTSFESGFAVTSPALTGANMGQSTQQINVSQHPMQQNLTQTNVGNLFGSQPTALAVSESSMMMSQPTQINAPQYSMQQDLVQVNVGGNLFGSSAGQPAVSGVLPPQVGLSSFSSTLLPTVEPPVLTDNSSQPHGRLQSVHEEIVENKQAGSIQYPNEQNGNLPYTQPPLLQPPTTRRTSPL